MPVLVLLGRGRGFGRVVVCTLARRWRPAIHYPLKKVVDGIEFDGLTGTQNQAAWSFSLPTAARLR